MSENNQKMAFVIDSTRCMGCKACIIACKDKHELPIGVLWRKVLECVSGGWTKHPDGAYTQNIAAYYISVACNHCENPRCVAACPTGATHIAERGIIAIDASRCVGCGNCKWNCPYSAPQMNLELRHMTKCDMCRDFLAIGKEPACVAACPARALHLVPRSEIKMTYQQANVAPLPNASLTDPNLGIIPHKASVPATDSSVKLINREEL